MYNVAIGEERGKKRGVVEPTKGEDEMTNDTQDSKAGVGLETFWCWIKLTGVKRARPK